MKYLLLCALTLSGCFAQVEPEPAPCPPVACGWEPDATTCLSTDNVYSARTHFEEWDDGGTACWIHDAVCVPVGTRPECVPAECRRTIAECQPVGPERRGGQL